MTASNIPPVAWLLIPVSQVESAVSTATSTVTPGAIMEKIKSGQWRTPIEQIRKVFSETLASRGLDAAKDAVAPMKKNLPGILFSGVFSRRKADALQTHSSLLPLDFDHLGAALPDTKAALCADSHVLALFVSPSGDGLKALVWVRATDEASHKACYAAAAQHFRDEYGLTTDPSGKDVSRLCFVSYDPDLFIREGKAEPFLPLAREEGEGRDEFDPGAFGGMEESAGQQDSPPAELVADALRAVPPNCAYSSWLQMGMALKSWDSVHGFRLWAAWSELAPHRTPKAGEPSLKDKWASFKNSGISIATLFHQARANGWKFPSGSEFCGKSAPGEKAEQDPKATNLPPSVDVTQWHGIILPPPDPVLEGAFDLGTKGLIVGPSKARKSFFMIQLLLSVAAGLPEFLTWTIKQARRVIYLNLEIPPAHFQQRIRRMMSALGITPEMLAGRFHVVNARGLQPSALLLPQIVERAREHQAEIFCVDPVYKLIAGDENKQEEIKPLLRMFDQLANKTNCAVLYCHHGQKGFAGDRQTIDRASGTGVLARDFDWMASLCHHQSHKETGMLVCEQIARSYPPKEAFSLGWSEAGYFMHSDADPVLLTSRNADKSGKVGPGLTDDDAFAVAVQKGPKLSNLFRAALKERGFSDHGARNAIDSLVEAGRLRKVSFGFPRRVYLGLPSEVEEHVNKLKNPNLPGMAQ